MKRLSAVLSVYNEEKNLQDCLESLKWVDEIIVVDNSSTDQTVKICQKYTDKIFNRPNLNMLNVNKNFGFTQATGQWILNLDADERVTPQLKEEILTAIEDTNVAGYLLSRQNIIFGKWIQHGLWWPDYQLRLFQRSKGKFACQHIHEKIEVTGPTANLKNPLVHQNYQTVSQFIQKMDRIYTENEAKNFLATGKKINWQDSIRMPIQDFLSVFFAREGYKDGLHGLVLALLQAFYALVVFAKVWEKEKFWEYNQKDFSKDVSQEFKKAKKETLFWLAKTQGFLSRLWLKIQF